MPPIINVQKISQSFGAKPLFQNVSFTVSEGDRIGLIGPNGSGKSTLLKVLAQQVDPDEGDIAIRKRAQDRVRQRMKDDVGIRMTDEAALMGNAHPADHDVIAVPEGVNVITRCGPYIPECAERREFSAGEIVRRGQFDVAAFAFEDRHRKPRPFGQRRVIGEAVEAFGRRPAMRREQCVEGKCLRGLHGSEPVSIKGLDHDARSVNGLDGIG